jgi:hypothetical protein
MPSIKAVIVPRMWIAVCWRTTSSRPTDSLLVFSNSWSSCGLTRRWAAVAAVSLCGSAARSSVMPAGSTRIQP